MSITLNGDSGITSPTYGGAVSAEYNVPVTAFKNLLIDAGFTINQREYVSAATLAVGSYGHDRWKAGASGGDYSFTQLATSTTITISSSKSLIQVVEDKNVNGTSFVLSWTGTAQARVGINSATPSGSYAASPILITGQTAGTTMSVEFNTGTLSNPQLEKGSTATSFDYRPYGTELALCQRYLPAYIYAGGSGGGTITGQAISTTQAAISIPFPVSARTIPTGITVSASTDFILSNSAGGSITSTAATFNISNSLNYGTILVTVASGLTAGNATNFGAGTANAKVFFTGCEL